MPIGPQSGYSRRDILAVTAIAGLAATLPIGRTHAAAGGLAPLAPADGLLDRTTTFLAGLDPEQRTAASFAMDGEDWRGWNYFGGSGLIKPGLRLEQMAAPQQDATFAVFAEVLSPAGLDKARTVMLLQDILAAMGNDSGNRSSKRFSIAVFGTPAATGRWGLRLEGHHLSLSFAVADGALVAVTPAAFAARPNRVTEGAHAGLNTLKLEEQLARQLQGDLTPKLMKRAQQNSRHLGNILSTAGRERDNAERIGVAAADMTAGQRDLLWQLVETYAVAPYAGPVAASQRQRVRLGDAEAVHFAWYGPNQQERSFGYRVVGDNFVIELGCVGADAQHLHPVYHDLGNVLGMAG